MSNRSMPADTLLKRILNIGVHGDDSEETKAEKYFLIYLGLLMSMGALIWGSLCLVAGLNSVAPIPFAYPTLTAINFVYFYYTKNFKIARFCQVFISLMLPFAFQWSLGGIIPSGAVMLWALIALTGSLTFQDVKTGIKWLMAFLVLTAFSGFIDGYLRSSVQVPPQVSTLFFVLNFAIISTIVLILNIYLLSKRDEAMAKASEMSSVLKKMFGRYLSDDVMTALIDDPAGLELGGQRRSVTIMMTDLRGFTALSERLDPEQVVKMLNTYFEVMVDVILKYNGTVNEFIGDALLVVFGAPQEMEDRAQRAVACAIEMQNAMAVVNERNSVDGLPELEMGIGLNETDVVVGNIGSTKRSKYAVVGSGVNLASRIESYTAGGQVFVSETVKRDAGEVLRIDARRDVLPKGAEQTFRIYEVGAIAGRYNVAIVEKTADLHVLTRPIPVRYTALEGKDVQGGDMDGLILKLSMRSAELSLGAQVEELANLKLYLRGVDGQLATKSFYGKVTGKIQGANDRYAVAFTSHPPEIDSYFQACLKCSTLP